MKIFLYIFLLLIHCPSYCQELNNLKQNQIKISKTNEPIKIDGELTEGVWQKTDVATDFWEIILRDKDKAKRRTEIRMTYDDQFLYISAYAQDTVPYISNSLKRDVGGPLSDDIWFALDPLNQKTNAFVFFLTAYGIQGDDAYSANRLNNLSFTWDTKWFSATKRYADHWTAEIALPFKSIRYSADKMIWGINFYRVDVKNGQYSGWTKIPINIGWNDIGYFGSLIWDAPPPAPGKNISLIPYITGSSIQNKAGNIPAKTKFNAGFDAKLAVSPSLNLDLTVNPDFSNVEVDAQVTNLSRFSIFFPEKRTFFLENADLYSDLGYEGIRPFYSRTIGLDPSGNTIPILGGARLSGNINKDWRIAVMNMQTGNKGDFAAQNYTAATVNRQVLKRSKISGYFFNRQGFLDEYQKQKNPLDEYGRNTGVEARYVSNTTKWKGYAGYHLSLKPGIDKEKYFVNLGAEYSTAKVGVVGNYSDVATNYYTDMGFVALINNYDARLDSVIRAGFKQLSAITEYRILPKKGGVNSYLFGVEDLIILNRNGSLNDHLSRLRYSMNLKNRSELKLRFDMQETRLMYFTKFTKAEPLPPGKYKYNQWNVEYRSDVRKPFTYSVNYRQGGFYNGDLFSLITSVNYRLQQWANVSMGFGYNKLSFPDPYGSTEFILISPRIEVYFTNNLFWTTFLQYNTQINNFNINSRLQWRYKPMSDFFLVYTDNYYSDPLLKNKNRAIVFKANYWLNL